MKSQLTIVLACLVGCALVACGRGEEKSPQSAPAGDAATDAATSAQDADQEAEQEATAASIALCNANTPKQTKVTSGRYCVCSIGGHEVHDTHKALHLQMGQEVIIYDLDWVTKVKLGPRIVNMMRAEDETELKSLEDYRHKIISTRDSEMVPHMVRISPETDPANLEETKCDKTMTKNVLRISFCYAKDNKWDCDPRLGEHNGDTHVQN